MDWETQPVGRGDLYGSSIRISYGIPIAFTIRSVDRSLFTRLIPTIIHTH